MIGENMKPETSGFLDATFYTKWLSWNVFVTIIILLIKLDNYKYIDTKRR
jgi:hypothetical protein